MIKPINIGREGPMLDFAEEIEFGECMDWIQNLKDTFESVKESAAGLAMNQIWDEEEYYPIRVFIAKNPVDGEGMVFINPYGKGSGGHIKMEEGCLSFPGRKVLKSRHKNFTIIYLDENGEEQNFKATHPFSAVLQHELDHLNGIVCIPKS